MLNGEYGEAVSRALKLIVRVGEALGAERLVRIAHAHASGISYFNIGDAGLEFIEQLASEGGRASVFATFNPVGIPLNANEDVLPANAEEREKQARIISALLRMGFKPSATCIPYMLRRPSLGEHLAWGESSAVAVANTLFGARTNREGGPIALAAAITGRVYEWGLHLDEARKPRVLVQVEAPSLDPLQAGLLGYLLGVWVGDKVAYVDAALDSKRSVISLCAAAAAAGSIGMCIVKGFSPEDAGKPADVEDRIAVEAKDLHKAMEEVSSASLEEAEAFFTGCPHHWFDIMSRLVTLFRYKGLSRLRKPLYVAVPGFMPRWAANIVKLLREKSVFVVPGTCLVVAKLSKLYRTIATDSLKAAFYLPRRHGIRVALARVEEFITMNAR